MEDKWVVILPTQNVYALANAYKLDYTSVVNTLINKGKFKVMDLNSFDGLSISDILGVSKQQGITVGYLAKNGNQYALNPYTIVPTDTDLVATEPIKKVLIDNLSKLEIKNFALTLEPKRKQDVE